MSNQDFTILIPFGYTSNMAVILINGQISDLCIFQEKICAVAVLTRCSAATTEDNLAIRRVIKHPINESRTIQTKWAVGSSRGIPYRPYLFHLSPSGIPPQFQALATPEVINLAYKRTSRFDENAPLR